MSTSTFYGTWPYCGHFFNFHIHLDWLGNCIIQFNFVNHKDCHSKVHDQSKNTKVIRAQNGRILNLEMITKAFLFVSTIEPRMVCICFITT